MAQKGTEKERSRRVSERFVAALISLGQSWDIASHLQYCGAKIFAMANVQIWETPRSPSQDFSSSDSSGPRVMRLYSSPSSGVSLPSRSATPEFIDADEGAPRELELSPQDSGVQPRYARRGQNRPVPAFGWENLDVIRRILTPSAAVVPMEIDPPFDTTGLKEIGNLASWTVSTCKPGCGVEALRDEDTNLFWQYDDIPSTYSSNSKRACNDEVIIDLMVRNLTT